MNYNEFETYLKVADVPELLWSEAIDCLEGAYADSGGTFGSLLFKKFKARLFLTKKIADAIPWEGDRLLDYKPEWKDWDIAPMKNITANGDNGGWEETPEGERPIPHYWDNPDPKSEDYKLAVSRNYWLPGHHPREHASRVAWYKRNAGEFYAWSLGKKVGLPENVQVWSGENKKLKVTIKRSGGAWEFLVVKKVLFWKLNISAGYEISNIFHTRPDGSMVQGWYPLDGYDLRATLVWAKIPSFK